MPHTLVSCIDPCSVVIVLQKIISHHFHKKQGFLWVQPVAVIVNEAHFDPELGLQDSISYHTST
jgi:hypothetical protein